MPLEASSQVSERLPSPLRDVYDACVEWASARRFSVAVHGSLTKGGVDRYSDIDLTLATPSSVAPAEAMEDFDRMIAGLGTVMAHFRADHLGANQTLIAYLGIDEWVVKLDVKIVGGGALVDLPPEASIVADAEGAMALARYVEPTQPDLGPLFDKLTGWFWFTYSRLARGEYFAAARSIDFTREHALLPILLSQRGLPQDGHRRIEERLTPDLLDALRRTHPVAIEPDAIFEALRALHALTVEALEASTLREEREPALARMWDIVCDARSRAIAGK